MVVVVVVVVLLFGLSLPLSPWMFLWLRTHAPVLEYIWSCPFTLTNAHGRTVLHFF